MTMTIEQAIKVAAALADLAESLTPQIKALIFVASSENVEQIKADLARLQDASDELHDEVQAKLRG